jgi:hypothetical protein
MKPPPAGGATNYLLEDISANGKRVAMSGDGRRVSPLFLPLCSLAG